MTLLISSLRRRDVLLTADGRSTLRTGTVVTGFRDQTQKFFAVENQPVVIGQHGQNAFYGHAIAEIIRKFAAGIVPGLGIWDIAKQLAAELHDEVRDTLWNLPRDTGAGVWVVGFGRGEDEPLHTEIFWKWEDSEFVTRELEWRPTDIVLAGNGKTGLHANIGDIAEASIATVQSVNAHLMKRALEAKVDPNPVGGHVHEVLVTPWEAKWTLPPARLGE